MCSLHLEVTDAFLILLELRLISEVHAWSVSLAKMFFITKSNTAGAWLVFLVVLQTELVAMVTHAVLAQKPHIFIFVAHSTELSGQW